MSKRAVFLLNYGGPTSTDDVAVYLENMFSDPDLLSIPLGPLRPFIARRMARSRAPHAARRYAQMQLGGGSPIVPRTREQAAALQALLGSDFAVRIGMRYSEPSVLQMVTEAVAQGIEEAVALPLFPQACAATTGTCQKALQAALATVPGASRISMRWIMGFADHRTYVRSVVERIIQAASTGAASAQTHLLFSAHNIPDSLRRQGDPYEPSIRKTMAAVLDALPATTTFAGHSLCWQSRTGPVRWLTPSAEEELQRLAKAGVQHLLVVPISFVSDNIENLIEVDVEQRALAQQLGFQSFRMMPSLNTQRSFIEALATLTHAALAAAPSTQGTPA